MTAPPPGRHLDLDAIADVEEGLAPREDEQVARAHLDECAECRQRLAQLRTTRALLTTLPAEAMPAAVVTRVDQALSAAGDSSTTIVPLARRNRFWNTPAIAGVAAAVAILVLVGAVVVGNVTHHHSSPSAGPAGVAAPDRPAAGAADVKEWATGTNYTPQNIAHKVPALVTGTPPSPSPLEKTFGSGASPGSAVPAPTGTGAAVTTDSLAAGYTLEQLRSSRAAVLGCGRILAGGVPTVPVAVDFARFNGKQAVIVVLPAVDHAATDLDVWVLPGTCSSSTIPLFIRRVPRP